MTLQVSGDKIFKLIIGLKSKKKDEIMKENKSKKGLASKIGAIIILVIAAFAFIYVPGMTQSAANSGIEVYGSYDGEEITNENGSYFMAALQQAYANAEANGQEITNDNFYELLYSAFNQTVLNMAFSSEVEKTKYVPTDKEITERMVQYISSQTDDPATFVASMSNNDKNNLYDAAKTELIYNRYVEDYFGNQAGLYGVKSSSAEADFVKNMNVYQRSFDMVSFAKDSYPESELLAFANKNPDLFVKHDLSAITADDEASLKSILDQINKNEITFEDAVSNLSTKRTTEDNGKFKNNFKYQLKVILTSEDDLNTVTNLKAGELSGVVKTASGYAIFRGDGANVPADFADETMLDTVNTYMITYEAGLIEDYFINLAQDFATDAVALGFDAAAEKYAVTPVKVGPFPINYGNSAMFSYLPTEAALSSATSSDEFFNTAFGLGENEISSPMVFGDYIVVLKLLAEEQGEPVDDFTYMYYTAMIDQYEIQNSVLNSDKVENKVLDVYFKQLFANMPTNE